MTTPHAQPRRCLSVASAASIVVGIVIGAGIFQFPSLVAMNVSSASWLIGLWVAGGIVSLIGALCYAELASTYPDAGGDYHFIGRAYGPEAAFLFAWARMTIIQTGSIALIAFVIGEYAAAALPIGGAYATGIYAALAVVLLTGLNLAGVRLGAGAQLVATIAVVFGLLMVIVAGFTSTPPAPAPAGNAAAAGAAGGNANAAIGLAMVFVLLTYGGWNEAAYLSAEVRSRVGIVSALLIGIAIVTVVYILMNLAMLHALGLNGMAGSMTIAADVMRARFGEVGAKVVSVVVVLAAATTANATIITGARSNYALGRDFPLLAPLSRWRDQSNTPTVALVVQGVIALVLVGFGSLKRNGLQSMVDYITPVFWLFFLLAGMSLFVLRDREPHAERPFKVPLYPLTPIMFCNACMYMLWSSLNYAGKYAWVGLAVLAAGIPLLLAARPRATMATKREPRGFPVEAEPVVQQQI
jgi:amino acid transporter